MKKRTIDVGAGLRRIRRRHGGALVGLAVGLAAVSSTAVASTKVSGTADSVTVDAQNSSIREVLSALGQKFHLQVDSSANLNKQISGSYHGSLGRVVARLLDGYNFILRTDQGELEVIVLGTENRQIMTGARGQGPTNTAGPPAAVNSPTNPVAGRTVAASEPVAPAKQLKPATSRSSPPASASPLSVFEFKVADGAAPVPGLGPATTSGPIPKPATSQMPQPTPSSAGPNLLPNPTPTQGVDLPMPTASAPFPGMSGGSRSQTPAPAAPSSQPTGSTASVPPAPAQSTTK